MGLSGLEQIALVVNVGDLVAGANDASFPIVKLQNRNISVVSAKIGVRTAATASGSNYAYISLMNDSGVCIAYLTTAAIGLTASIFREMTLNSSPAEEIDEGETITLDITQASDGVGLCGITIQIEYEITE